MIDTTKYTQVLIFKRHWVLAVTVALTFMTLAIPVALGAPDIYRSSAKLVVQRQAIGSAAQAAIAGGLDTRLQVIRQDALSRGQIIKLINDLDLYPELREKTSLDVVIDRVQRDISVMPQTVSIGNGSQVMLSFTVGYVGSEPEMVASVANKLASFWVEQNSTLRTQQVSQEVVTLKAQVDEAKKGVDDASAKMASYIANNPGAVPDAVTLKMQELQRVNTDLGAKTATVTQLKQAHNTFTTRIADLNATATSTGVTPDQQKLSEKLKRVDDCRSKGELDDGPNLKILLPEVRALEAKIAKDAAAAQSSAGGGSSLLAVLTQQLKDTDKDLADTTDAVKRLETQSSVLQTQINNAPVRNPQYDALKGEVTVAQDTYNTVKKSYERAQLDAVSEKAQDVEEFSIQEPARAPAVPWGPNRLNLIVASVFIALVLGVGAAVLRDQLDTSFHTLEELRMFTTVPVLGSIPKITTAQQKASRVFVLAAAGCGLIVVLAVVGDAAYRYAQRHEGITRMLTK